MERRLIGDGGGVGLLMRWVQLAVGMFGFGLSISLMIRSGLGLGPWDAFHVGLHELSGLSVGLVTIVVGVLVVGASWFIGVRPGAGTLVNMLLIGVFVDLLLPRVPGVAGWTWGLAYYAVAIALAGLSTGMYIAPGLGKGPRDGLMIGISQRTAQPVARVRTLVELGVLVCGWAMGGTIGVGTVIFALTIGPAMQWGLRLFGVLPEEPGASRSQPPATPRRERRKAAA